MAAKIKEYKKRYRYMCKLCYKSWTSVNHFTKCLNPDCKATEADLDVEEELIL